MVLRFFLFAVMFIFATCAQVERDNPNDPEGNNYHGVVYSSSKARVSSSSVVQSSSSVEISSSSEAKPSSSSVVLSSSSIIVASSSSVQSGIIYGTSVNYEGEIYKTVVIGSKTWFQRNLNYAVVGSKCYKNEEVNCTKYGRLYNWGTANNVCPSDWHLPSNADWNNLTHYVDGTSSPNLTAGKYLKATNGWDNNGNGQDTYGFSALPSGYGHWDGSFGGIGREGFWWSSSESEFYNKAYIWSMYYIDDRMEYYDDVKNIFLSVRCVKD